MTYQELVTKVMRLSVEEQRALIATVTRALDNEHQPQRPSLATRLRGIAKRPGLQPTDQEHDDYADYLERKYA